MSSSNCLNVITTKSKKNINYYKLKRQNLKNNK